MASSGFYAKARHDGRSLGLPDPRIAVFTHPLGGLSEDQIVDRSRELYDSMRVQLARIPETPAPPQTASAQRIQAPAEPAELQAWFFNRGLSDGLPVIPPTPKAVSMMVEGSGRRGEALIGIVPPRGGVATVEQIA